MSLPKLCLFSFIVLAVVRYGATQNDRCSCTTGAVESVENCLEMTREFARELSLLGDDTDESYALTELDRRFYVLYLSPRGTTSACDHSQRVARGTTLYPLDPAIADVGTSWNARFRPVMDWRVESDDQLYMVLLVHFETGKIHMAYSNIQQNNLDTAWILKEYEPPIYTQLGTGHFTFLLYKQNVEVRGNWEGVEFNKAEFEETYDLEGPVGLNWISVNPGVYGAQYLLQQFDQNICPTLMQAEMEASEPNFPFLNQPMDLEVFLRVRFTSPRFTYQCGGFNVTQRNTDIYLDPIQNPLQDVIQIRTDSTITFEALPIDNVIGKLFTMMVVDESARVLHGLIIDMPGDDLADGTIVFPYRQPNPPSGTNTYFFLLFEQSAQITLTGTEDLQTRSRADLYPAIHDFLTLHNLRLVGLSRMRATNDDYVQCLRDG